MIKQNIV